MFIFSLWLSLCICIYLPLSLFLYLGLSHGFHASIKYRDLCRGVACMLITCEDTNVIPGYDAYEPINQLSVDRGPHLSAFVVDDTNVHGRSSAHGHGQRSPCQREDWVIGSCRSTCTRANLERRDRGRSRTRGGKSPRNLICPDSLKSKFRLYLQYYNYLLPFRSWVLGSWALQYYN